MEQINTRVEIKPDIQVTLKISAPEGRPPRKTLVLGHGMANDLDFPLLVQAAEILPERGYEVVRFNFPYREAGRDRADAEGLLETSFIETTRFALGRRPDQAGPLVLGGKSLGARIAAGAAAKGMLEPEAMAYLGFPLQPPGRPELGRQELLVRAGTRPQFFAAGTRDPLCPLDRLEPVLAELSGPVRLHIVPGGDHSFFPPQNDPRRIEDINREIILALADWLDNI